MFENERDWRKLVAGMNTNDEPNALHRARLRGEVLQTFEGTRVRGKAGVHGARFTASRLAIAATILVALSAAVWTWSNSASRRPAFARIRAATESEPWLYAVATRYSDGDAQSEKYWCNLPGKETYVVAEDTAVVGYNYGSSQMKLAYSPRLKTLTISELPKTGVFGVESAYNFVQAFSVFAAKDDIVVEQSTGEREGQPVWVYAIETAPGTLSIDGKEVGELRMTAFADPRTKRIVAAGVEYEGADGALLAHEDWVMNYPQTGPASIYDVGVPRTARVFDMRPGYRGTPGAEPAPISTPVSTGGFRLEPLKIELPKRKFVSALKDGRPPFLAPAGTINLARGKPVSSSDSEPLTGSLDLVTDGDKEATEGSVVELGPKPQYITIDLQESCEIYAVVIWHQHRWSRVYYDVVVQVCDDPTFTSGVHQLFNNDLDDSLGFGTGRDLHYTETYEGKLIEGKSTQGRYIRCYSNGNTHDELNHYIEVEVYGRPVRSIQSN